MTVRVKDHGYDALMKRMAAATRKRGVVTVGIHEAEAAEPEGDSGATVGEVAAIQEMHGRSFVRASVDQNEGELQAGLRVVGRAVVSGSVASVDDGLERLGARAAAGMRDFVNSGEVSPADKPETIAKKGSSTPLVDSGNLVSKIAHKVAK